MNQNHTAPAEINVATSTLTGSALDWAVALTEGVRIEVATSFGRTPEIFKAGTELHQKYQPSTNWNIARPIMEREEIACDFKNKEWHSDESTGPTYLIAAMRRHVADWFGSTIDIPAAIATN